MPELPEVEVLRRSLEPLLAGERIEGLRVRNAALREPVDRVRLGRAVRGRRILGLRRRAKYLLVDLAGGRTLVVHLGMSGRLTLAAAGSPVEAHEHVSFALTAGRRLAFRDPRRFGLVLALPTRGLEEDRHFASLGVEPLGEGFSGELIAGLARGRRAPVKGFLMDGRLVVGVGNIYASEALFLAGIRPGRAARRVSGSSIARLVDSVRITLARAIEHGGTTLQDFTQADGKPGYFRHELQVYGNRGACPACGHPVRQVVISQRASYYCSRCQI